MKTPSVYKLLYLLNLLFEKEYNKKEIIGEFQKKDIPITKPLINNYIDKFLKYKFDVEIRYDKKEAYYKINLPKRKLNLTQDELNSLDKLKKVLIAQKNYNRIRIMMRIFYRFARHIEDSEQQRQFINFDYYSTINWYLVAQLERHCENKDIITIDYLLPNGGNKFLTIHADSITISEWSEKMYLKGALFNSKHLSILPIDRIYMVKKVEKEKQPLELYKNLMTYVVLKDTYLDLAKDEKEKIIEDKDGYLTIERPTDDDFYILQRLLCCCPNVKYISDKRVKSLFREKLQTLKEIYDKSTNDK